LTKQALNLGIYKNTVGTVVRTVAGRPCYSGHYEQ